MKEFQSTDGFLHFLFAEEDKYYLENLVELDFRRDLFYCLKKEKYRGVFFLEPRGAQSSLVMEDAASVEIYNQKKLGGLFAKNPPAVKESRNGTGFFRVSFPQEADLLTRFHLLLRSGDDRLAFVMSLKDFDRLYRNEQAFHELLGIVRKERRHSILVLTSSLRAGESLDTLTNPDGPLCSELCPVLQKAILREERFQPYEELLQGMEKRVSFWNQMGREQILRLIEREELFHPVEPAASYTGNMAENRNLGEALPVSSARHNANLADFIYAWYHSEELAAVYPGLLSENEEHLMTVLARDLEDVRKRSALEGVVRKLEEKLQPEERLLSVLEKGHVFTERFMPRIQKSPELMWLKKISVSRLMGACGEVRVKQTVRDYAHVLRDLRKPYSDAALMADEKWLQECLAVFRTLENRGFADPDTVEKAVDYLEYCVCRDDRYRRPELFREKTDYYRQIIRASLEAGQTEADYRDLAEQERECSRQLREKMLEVKQAEREAPLASQNLSMALAGQEALHGDTLLANAAKEAVVNISRQRENIQRMMSAKLSRVQIFRSAIQQMELSMSQLSGEDMTDLAQYVQNATDAMARKALLENKLRKELKEAEDDFRFTQEELQKQRLDNAADLAEEYKRIEAQLAEEDLLPGRKQEQAAENAPLLN